MGITPLALELLEATDELEATTLLLDDVTTLDTLLDELDFTELELELSDELDTPQLPATTP